MPSAFFQLDPSWRFAYANAEAVRLLGGIGADLIGAVIWELFPDAVGTDFETHYRGAVATGEPVTFEAYYPAPLDSWYEVRAWPGPDGLSVYFLQINDRHEARVVLARSTERSALLAEVTGAMSGTLEAAEAAQILAELLVPRIGDWCIVTLADGETAQGGAGVGATVGGPGWRRGLHDSGWAHADPGSAAALGRYAEGRLAALADDSFLARALAGAGTVVVSGDAALRMTDEAAPGPMGDLLAELDPWSAVFVSLVGHGRVLGLLSVFRDRARESFTPAAVSVVEEIAGRAGLVLDNARLYREQHDLAAELQQSMLTAPPEPDHLHVAVRYVPAAQAAQVGGDWYDAFLQPDGGTVVVIGDVVGHDTAAAAAMGQLRSILRGIAVTTGAAPAEVLSRVDEAMDLLMLRTSATVVVARFEQTPEEREAGLTRMRWSNAGHPPPIVVAHPDEDPVAEAPDHAAGAEDERPDHTTVLWGAPPNMLLGFQPDVERDETVLTLRRGATVLLYTDGLVERRTQDLDTGVALLRSTFTELVADGVPLEELCDELIRRLLPDRPDDDVAIVAVRLFREDRPRPAAAGPSRTPDRFEDPPPG